MLDIISQLQRRGERGEVRGTVDVLRRARADAARRGVTRRRTVGALAIGGAAAAIVGSMALADWVGDSDQTELSSIAGSTAQALKNEGTGSVLVWTSAEGTTNGSLAFWLGDPSTGEVRRLAPVGDRCGLCPVLRVGRSLFVGGDTGVQRLDPPGSETRQITRDDVVFPSSVFPSSHPGELYVGKASRQTPNGSQLKLVDLDGALLGGPWQMPPGYELTYPPRATREGVVVQSPPNSDPRRFALWQPGRDSVSDELGEGSHLIDTVTSVQRSVVAWTGGDCTPEVCQLLIRDLDRGSTRVIDAPGSDLGYIGGGAFSPDGTKLAAFAVLDRGWVGGDAGGRRMELTIIDTRSGNVTAIAGAVDEFGEDFGFATWSPDGRWVFFGGLRSVRAHRLGTSDAIALHSPGQYSVVAVDESFDDAG